MIENTPRKNKAFIAGVNLNDSNFDYYMTELANLTEAANMEVVGQARQNAEHIVAGTYFGLGKINEIKDMARGLKAKVLILNDELTPVQIRNLEKLTKLRVIDRTELILEIFSKRARTKQAKLQVQLARLQYELPRLHPSENNLDQQRGNGGSTGGGFANRGAGESKLELNRRTIGKQIAIIKNELKEISQQEEIKAKRRNQNNIPKVALVGYTNAGKSTTMNGLLQEFSKHSDKQVFVKNMLFATLDTNVRRIELDNNFSFILSDTVGFISKLPHNLVESFKATLQEVRDADLLINVVDASDPNMIQMIRTTQNVLNEIGIKNTPMITAYNKADKSERNYPQIEGSNILYSATDPKSITTLANLITKRIFVNYKRTRLLLPLSDGKTLSYLHENAQVISENFQNDGIHVTVRLAPEQQNRFSNYIV
ncbi:GTPase HflX [Lactobacillus helsingborgensis]|uniref:GTPase HflX n=1 Tax=Lactobacillus helsingborgensis TaxID=1218494 RepID=A0A0F4LVY0_9LACO|nr:MULTISPECIES: GTPase HflX [Lactobacillus]AWN33997.1 GTPase HflX [Lactobacillus helsingborgensis]KJY62917.1 GTPase HflX [Lactobacillus helsingborgensis]RMC52398.1 GTPase HflX [Lactobacillus sp. ESL0262]UZX29390.1 GTPase HflX [Lactobacillus helsingborgensis]